jgi:hypothetical protein
MASVPDVMPILSAGKHRSPRGGGCFMEIAGFLAGERWSDHPKCADPSLAELARCINDVMPDERRSELAPMIPSVIGTGGRDATERTLIAARIVRECTVAALPVVDVKTRPLACALVLAERILGQQTPQAQLALAAHPEAAAYAGLVTRGQPRQWRETRAYLSLAVPQALRCAVRAISDELGAGSPDVLVRTLAASIDAARRQCGLDADPLPLPEQRWAAACELVGRRPNPADAA